MKSHISVIFLNAMGEKEPVISAVWEAEMGELWFLSGQPDIGGRQR
jgi:hypothetical protein